MDEERVEAVTVNERINGWWVSVRYASGHEEHHGPYQDQESAESEAELLSPQKLPPADSASIGRA